MITGNQLRGTSLIVQGLLNLIVTRAIPDIKAKKRFLGQNQEIFNTELYISEM